MPVSGTDSVGNFTRIDFILRDVSGAVQRTITYTTTGDNWITPATTAYVTIPAGVEWTIQVETKAAAGAKAVSCYIEFAIDVDE
jgi:hypothetical protein